MSFDGVKIFENDFACDIHDDFFERYDAGQNAETIAQTLTVEYKAEILSAVDDEVFVTALADCLWSIGQPVDQLRQRIFDLLDSQAAASFWGKLYPSRKNTLQTLIKKLSKPKAQPVMPKKTRLPKRLPFSGGDYLLFAKKNGKQVVVMVTEVETRGTLRYHFAVPNMSRSTDIALIGKLLTRPAQVSDDELASFFSKSRRFRMTEFDHTALKDHLGRFRKIGHREFNWSKWQYSSCSYCITFDDFERFVDESGTRGLSPEELQLVKSNSASDKGE